LSSSWLLLKGFAVLLLTNLLDFHLQPTIPLYMQYNKMAMAANLDIQLSPSSLPVVLVPVADILETFLRSVGDFYNSMHFRNYQLKVLPGRDKDRETTMRHVKSISIGRRHLDRISWPTRLKERERERETERKKRREKPQATC